MKNAVSAFCEDESDISDHITYNGDRIRQDNQLLTICNLTYFEGKEGTTYRGSNSLLEGMNDTLKSHKRNMSVKHA